MILKDPWILLFIPLIAAGVWIFKRRQPRAALRFPSLELVSTIGQTWKTRFIELPLFLRMVALVLMLIALAGPRSILKETETKTEGIDIVLAIDASGSMLAEDFTINGVRMNRLDVVKQVVSEFIDGRKNDRMGLIGFGGVAYTISPLTTDYNWLKTNLDRLVIGLIEDGTAIGSGASAALSRLRNSKAKSKVIVLLTDGINNAGKVDPLAAAQAAKAMGVRIYTIGAGTKGYAPYPVEVWGKTIYQKVKIDIDEDLLRQMAEITGGQYFRATDTNSLKQIYQQIDRLEKTEIEMLYYHEYKERFGWFLVAALALILLDVILSNTVLLRVP